MRLSFLGLSAIIAAAASAGCGSADLAPLPGGQDVVVPAVNATIAFEQQGTVKLTPGKLAHLSVATTPPNSYAIAFRLVGDSLDASLDRSTAVAGSDGRATVVLRAPSVATTFAVRATIKDGPSADIVVSVSDKGFATLDVKPIYNGKRPVDAWVASAAAGSTCDALAATLPNDPEGALKNTATVNQPLIIADAPVGPALAVVVRAGHYAWGCTDAMGLAAGTTTKVEVHVVNKPLDPTLNQLDLALEIKPEPDPWQALVAQHFALLSAPFAKDGQPKALLDAMTAVAADPAAFKTTASNNGWLVKLQNHWTAQKVDLVAWLQSMEQIGLGGLPAIKGRVKSVANAEHSLFTLKSFGLLDAADAGVPNEYLMSLAIDPDDSVHLGGTLYLMPSRYLGAAINAAALAQAPDKKTMAEQLGQAAACDKLPLASADCNAECMSKLCKEALGALWQDGLDASAAANLPAQIPMNASGAAKFNDGAALTGFSGTWLGQLSSGKVLVKVTGAATATAVDVGPPN